jgi:hypothetical protein
VKATQAAVEPQEQPEQVAAPTTEPVVEAPAPAATEPAVSDSAPVEQEPATPPEQEDLAARKEEDRKKACGAGCNLPPMYDQATSYCREGECGN